MIHQDMTIFRVGIVSVEGLMKVRGGVVIITVYHWGIIQIFIDFIRDCVVWIQLRFQVSWVSFVNWGYFLLQILLQENWMAIFAMKVSYSCRLITLSIFIPSGLIYTYCSRKLPQGNNLIIHWILSFSLPFYVILTAKRELILILLFVLLLA